MGTLLKTALLLPLPVFLAACGSDDGTARKALHAAGYTDVVITGWSPGACPQFGTGFKAKGPTGASVKGVVCTGMTGATIRIY